MRRPTFAALTSAAVLCLSTIALAPSASAAPSGTGLNHANVHVCAAPVAGAAACDAIRHDTVTSSGTAAPMSTTVPAGAKTPAQIQSAYGLPGAAATKSGTVAIVDAYNAPYAESDLNHYRSQFGIPQCTSVSGCFTKVSQTGSTTALPRNNGGWAQEISLDLDMVSAACPTCKILLVEASSASFTNLAAAENWAAKQPGVVAISNSYGGSDSTSYASSFNHPGIAITASTGDNGYGVSSPASLPTVIAVGGTSLNSASNARGWTETAWSGAGSGCSSLNPKPTYQTSATQCAGKATADVSAVADPNTGVAVYDSYAYQGYSGWMQFGGTSASSPIIASVFAQGPSATDPAAHIWGNASALNDVTSGSNGTCTTTVWCTAGTGWDGPTGLGTPAGVGAF
ncbi:MAG: S53 family peptidase [Blastococcus sp.]